MFDSRLPRFINETIFFFRIAREENRYFVNALCTLYETHTWNSWCTELKTKNKEIFNFEVDLKNNAVVNVKSTEMRNTRLGRVCSFAVRIFCVCDSVSQALNIYESRAHTYLLIRYAYGRVDVKCSIDSESWGYTTPMWVHMYAVRVALYDICSHTCSLGFIGSEHKWNDSHCQPIINKTIIKSFSWTFSGITRFLFINAYIWLWATIAVAECEAYDTNFIFNNNITWHSIAIVRFPISTQWKRCTTFFFSFTLTIC